MLQFFILKYKINIELSGNQDVPAFQTSEIKKNMHHKNANAKKNHCVKT